MNDSTNKKVLALEKLLAEKNESFWIKRGYKNALDQFKASKNVPAYRDFLKNHIGRIPAIRNIKDFSNLPILSKAKYLRAYPFEKLFKKGMLSHIPRVFSTTSGSTGEPFYFPRTDQQDKQYQLIAELYLRTNFKIQKKTTLYIDAFPMGPWIGGVFTYEVITRIARESSYPLSIITAGIDTQCILHTIKKLGRLYDQIIIGSYGPFAKDIIDTGIDEGVDWKIYNVKFVFSAEAFPESFREYVGTAIGSKNILLDTLNHYGTVDLGTMSYETPICILIRRLAEKNNALYQRIFGDIVKIPTLTQYIPELFYFESMNGNLHCTSDSAIPLVRYNLEDRGGIIGFEEMRTLLNQFGINIIKEAGKHGIKKSVWKLPFAYVFERSDFSVSYYAFQVYPGPIRRILLEKNIQKSITGKFTIESVFSKQQNPRLSVHVELKKGANFSKKLLKEIREVIHRELLKTHSEYKETIKHFGNRAKVTVVLWSYGSPEHFKSGTKQKWIKK